MRLAALVLATACATAPTAPREPASISRVLEVASEVHHPLVVMFYAQWCKACHAFIDRVLREQQVQAELADIIFVVYDIDQPHGSGAAGYCRVEAIPTVLALDTDGNILSTLSATNGGYTIDNFLAFVRATRVSFNQRAAGGRGGSGRPPP